MNFEFSSRERNTTESKVIGTGLGLAIVKESENNELNAKIPLQQKPCGIGGYISAFFKYLVFVHNKTSKLCNFISHQFEGLHLQ